MRLGLLCAITSPMRASLMSTSMRFYNPPHPATLPLETLRRECTCTHSTSSGPGGQHRNRVKTAVLIRHTPTEIMASATEARSQSENMKRAVFRLRVRLALQLRIELPPVEPSALWAERSKGGRLKINEKHVDFPSILAEALDTICLLQGDVVGASQVSHPFRHCASTHLLW